MNTPLHRRYDRGPVLIGPSIARFRDPAAVMAPTPPFPAYEAQPTAQGPVPSGWRVRPAFSRRGKESWVQIETGPGVSLYGTGEQVGPLLRNGESTLLWNNDHFDYNAKSRNLYQSHPFILAVRPDGSAFGVLIETTYRAQINLDRRILVRVFGPSPAVTVIERPDPMGVVRALSDLTGRMPMPPLWSLGYHQCRWSYEPEGEVRRIAAEFRSRNMPCDVIWLDIDYMNGFRVFTFDANKFPDPAGLNAELAASGFRTIYMIDPGVKVDPLDRVYAEGRDGGHFVTTASGAEYRGNVWPGECAFPDFTRNETRRWWAGLYEPFLRAGMDGVWNDMNEPAVFGGVEKTMPVSNQHRADPELGGPGDHAMYHNIYGMMMVRASREGIAAARPDRRPFLLTRSNFLGGHRFAATWTGDNRSDWNHLRWSIPMALNLGLSGQPFAGPDIGGFIGDADAALFARWMGIGALLPFARAHSEKTTRPHEPWVFGDDCERTCRLALTRRYRLLPYLYTLFRHAHLTGEPVVRPVFTADPANPRLRTIDTAFLLGPDVLVQCEVHPDIRGGPPPLPWRPFDVVDETDPDLPRLYLRPGSAVPVGPVREWTGQPAPRELLLVAALDHGSALGEVYEDAGDGFGYERGEYTLTRYRVTRQNETAAVETAAVEGSLNAPPWSITARLV